MLLVCSGAACFNPICCHMTEVCDFVGKKTEATKGPGNQLLHLHQEHTWQISSSNPHSQAHSHRKPSPASAVPGYSQPAQGSSFSDTAPAHAGTEGMKTFNFSTSRLSSPEPCWPCPAAAAQPQEHGSNPSCREKDAEVGEAGNKITSCFPAWKQAPMSEDMSNARFIRKGKLFY